MLLGTAIRIDGVERVSGGLLAQRVDVLKHGNDTAPRCGHVVQIKVARLAAHVFHSFTNEGVARLGIFLPASRKQIGSRVNLCGDDECEDNRHSKHVWRPKQRRKPRTTYNRGKPCLA